MRNRAFRRFLILISSFLLRILALALRSLIAPAPAAPRGGKRLSGRSMCTRGFGQCWCAHARGASIALVACVVAVAVALPVASADDIDRLAWLSGCWTIETSEPGSMECWMPPAGGTMLGTSRTVRGGRTVQHEFLQIRVNAGGSLVYVAAPSGQAETAFVATEVTATSVTFENPAHDFPQRIRYTLAAPDRLTARVEGSREGVGRGFDVVMVRDQRQGGATGNEESGNASGASNASPPKRETPR